MSTLSSVEELDFAAAMPATAVFQPASDHALLQGTLAGDEDAFAELVGRYRNQITSYIYRMTNDYDAAVDLTQETFLRAFQAIAKFRGDADLKTWLYRIAINQARNRWRWWRRRRRDAADHRTTGR